LLAQKLGSNVLMEFICDRLFDYNLFKIGLISILKMTEMQFEFDFITLQADIDKL